MGRVPIKGSYKLIQSFEWVIIMSLLCDKVTEKFLFGLISNMTWLSEYGYQFDIFIRK